MMMIQLDDKIKWLQSQADLILKTIEKLVKKYSGLEESMASNKYNALKATEYYTDEEGLSEETKLIRSKNRKKRKMNTSLKPPQPQQHQLPRPPQQQQKR